MKANLSFEEIKTCCHDEMSGNGILYLFEEKLKALIAAKNTAKEGDGSGTTPHTGGGKYIPYLIMLM